MMTEAGSVIEAMREDDEEIDRKGSHVSNKNSNSKGNRHQRRKTAQSTRFNTIAQHSNAPIDYMVFDKSNDENF
jgi:hypothetical protein